MYDVIKREFSDIFYRFFRNHVYYDDRSIECAFRENDENAWARARVPFRATDRAARATTRNERATRACVVHRRAPSAEHRRDATRRPSIHSRIHAPIIDG